MMSMLYHHKTPYHRPKGPGETTPKQRLAVDLLISGKARNKSDALRKAGYNRGSVSSKSKLFKSVGVLKYLARLDKKSQKKIGRSIQDNVMGTYFSALKATKLYGKNAIKHPDFRTRIESADCFARLFGWEKEGGEG